jgi:hypothetical protein
MHTSAQTYVPITPVFDQNINDIMLDCSPIKIPQKPLFRLVCIVNKKVA